MLPDMEASRARVEEVAARVALYSRLVEMALYGEHEWTVLIGGEHNPAEVSVSLDDDDRLVLSVLVSQPTGNSPVYEIYVDGTPMQTAPGQIQRGRPCRLRLRYGNPSDTARV